MMDRRKHCNFKTNTLWAKVFFFTALFAGLFTAGICHAAEEPSLPEKPDLNVTYISQRPLYPGYWLEYPDDVPTFWVADKNSPDGSRKVSKEEFARLVKHKHAEGDEVTFTAHVRNNGFVPSPKTDYRLYIDGKIVKKGEIKALDVEEDTGAGSGGAVYCCPAGRSLSGEQKTRLLHAQVISGQPVQP